MYLCTYSFERSLKDEKKIFFHNKINYYSNIVDELLFLYLGPFKYTNCHKQYTIFYFSIAKTNHLI